MMEERKGFTADEIRSLIERVDGELREAERLRNYADERNRRPEFFPERRKRPRVPTGSDEDSSSGASA
jgi:hypothetical protein